ncbi:MAG TPA: type II toxin-antitoxin system VapC family toxin [Vicinamibacterales bacterium]|nr:type II toxin-antitoxin system VapC family toxin [Vicinamibacterales bacterium]
MTSAGTLIDTNVLFDFLSHDAEWFDWSAAILSSVAERGPIMINPIVYAEVSVRYDRIEDVELALPDTYFVRAPLPWDAAFLAAKCFARYRRRGGRRAAPLPDFFIGAHAAVSGLALLTRDPRRYRTYFPTLLLITP